MLHCVLSCSVLSDCTVCLADQSCPALWDPMDLPRLLCPWGFSRQEYWRGLPCPPPGDLSNLGMEPRSPALQVDSLPSEPPEKSKNTGVGSPSLLQGIFPTQESNWVSYIAGGFFSSWATRESQNISRNAHLEKDALGQNPTELS